PVTASTAVSTLSLHDALPIWFPSTDGKAGTKPAPAGRVDGGLTEPALAHPLGRPGTSQETLRAGGETPCPTRSTGDRRPYRPRRDRKSTRLNSSHVKISYAVF